MTKWITRTFFKGVAVVLPVVAAIYVIIWLVRDTEIAVQGLLLRLVPEQYYFPGVGLLIVLVAVFLIGLLMYPWLTRKMFDGLDAAFRKIPLFGTIYSPVRDLMDLMGGDMTEKLGQVVMIKVPNTNMETLGFVTRDDLSDLPDGFTKDDHVVVFVQWSSQIGGYCFIVPSDSVRPVDMTVEEGMRWALTGGISAPSEKQTVVEKVAKTDQAAN
jgi:uncharacterized membrane protein